MSENKIKINGNGQVVPKTQVVISFAPGDSDSVHTDEMDDIITTVPSWLLRWGITVFFFIIVFTIGLSAFIRYPDIVKTHIKINSINSPKPVVSKTSGKLTRLLVAENEKVSSGQALAYLESTADHSKVLALLSNLATLQQEVFESRSLNMQIFNKTDLMQLGELQPAYQAFYQQYITYSSTVGNGFLLKKKNYLQGDLLSIEYQQKNLDVQKSLQQRDFTLAQDEYEIHKNLAQKQVESKAELRQQERNYLLKKTSLVQMELSSITAENNYAAKQKDILELENEIQEEKAKFLQAINSLLSSAEDWKSKYVLSASQAGKLSFAGIIQENNVLTAGQEIFYIDPGDGVFFGEMAIPQNNMGKISEGQKVLIKLKSYPFEQYGIIRGKISYIADVPYKDSVFISKVNFKIKTSSDVKKNIRLKQGMIGDAEIITQDASILQRLSRNVIKNLNNE